MYKAKFVTAIYDRNPLNRHSWMHTDLLYEYRGYQYIVTKDNNGYMGEPLRYQHEKAQREIDERIKRNNEEPTNETEGNGSWQEGFDAFWRYVEGEEDK